MIKNRVVYSCMAILLVFFIVMVAVLPNVNIETKNDEFSYETLVFNKSKVTTVDIEMAEEDWEDLLANASDEEYKQANVTVNGKKVENVAIRTKGNLSLRSVINSDSDRYSLKIDFDYYDNTQSLYGLKKLNLNNNYSDTTLMREYISYELMDKMGLPTPCHSYMYVTVNGEERGLYVGVEAVDETFLAKNYGSNNGFLFKPDGAGSDLQYISDNIEDYTGIGLKTNEDHIEDSKLIEMLDAINNGGNLEQYLDVDEMLRYFAVNTALVNLDSYQGNMKHNYYLYEDNGVFSIIPWDYNMSFGGFGAGGGGGMGDRPNQDQESTATDTSNPEITDDQASNTNNTEVTDDMATNIPMNGEGMQPPPNGEMPQGGPQQQGNQPPSMNGDMPDMPPSEQDQNLDQQETQASTDMIQDTSAQEDASTNVDVQKQNGNRPQRGGMDMGMSSNLMNESAINFSITTPVSGTTLEERPLLNALLSNDEYREIYEGYLEELATNYLTEDYIQSITTNLAAMLTTYVEADPTKFSTTEQFLEAVEGNNSLPEFAKQRSESILKQLSGELVVEADTSSQGGGPQGNNAQNGEMNGNPPEMPDDFDPSQIPADFDPSQMPQGDTSEGQAGDQNQAQMQRPDKNGEGMGMPGQTGEQTAPSQGIDRNTVLTFSISTIVLLLALIVVFRFNRRGR